MATLPDVEVPRRSSSVTRVPLDAVQRRSRCTSTCFEGPFDLLLSLISKHQLDVTEVALSQVTDEFIG